MKIDNKSLNLSSKTAMSYVKGLAKFLKDEYKEKGFKVEIYEHKETTVFRSYSSTACSKKSGFGIGIKEIFKPNLLYLPSNYKKVKDNDFVNTIVSIFHESRHLNAKLFGCKYFRDNKMDDYYVQLSYMAREGNDSYYINNYNSMAYEIDAEQYAINAAFEYLKCNFSDDVDCEQLIVNYVNGRIRRNEYKIDFVNNHDEYTSLDQINKAFDDKFDKSKSLNRYVDFNSTDQITFILKNKGWLQVKKQIENMSQKKIPNCGFQMDEMMASLAIYQYPEYSKRLPKEWQKKLSPKEVFGLDEYPLEDWEIDKYNDYNR